MHIPNTDDILGLCEVLKHCPLQFPRINDVRFVFIPFCFVCVACFICYFFKES